MSLDADLRVQVGAFELQATFAAADGELVVVAGPNGAGKTTLLRALAGLERITAGRIVLGGRVHDDGTTFVRPDLRDVALLPQRDYLLPHLSAADNVAFGLVSRGTARRMARPAALDGLDAVGLRDVAAARPHELSGGQARRVALARTLAVRPALLLLDEPLAGIDASSARVVRDVLRSYDASPVRVVVAHDAVHALSLANRVVVLEDGRVAQDASVEDIRARPRSRYVADFLGVNLLHGVARGGVIALDGGGELTCAEPIDDGVRVSAVVHPHAVSLYEAPPEGSPRNTWRVRVAGADEEGTRVRVRLDGPPALVAEVTAVSARSMSLAPGAELYASVKATEITVFPA